MKKRSTWDAARAWVGEKLVHPDARRSKYDTLENQFLGFGTGRDKLHHGHFTMHAKLSDQELYALYYTDHVSAKIVNKGPEEMLRRGYKLTSKKNPKGAEALQKIGESETLQVSKKILRGLQWGALWGGAVGVMGANDSTDLSLPLNPGGVREVRYLNVIDRRYVTVTKYQEDPTLPRFGEPEIYGVGGVIGVPIMYVHASRIIRFVGVPETDPITLRQLNGWTYSKLQRPYDVIRSFAMQFKALEHLMSDASQGVWKIQSLLEMLGSNRDELMTRMVFADMTRSAGRALMLDAETEDFERIATSFAGLKDVLETTMMQVSAAADLPVTLLMGRSPAGQNATGDSDFRAWYDVLGTDQINEVKPAMLQVYNVISRGEIDDLDIEFPPLWQPTEQEKATTYLATAQGDQIYSTVIGAVQAEQIAIARFGSGNGKIKIDEDALNISLSHEIELMKMDPQEKAEHQAEIMKTTQPQQPADADPKAKPDAAQKPPSK